MLIIDVRKKGKKTKLKRHLSELIMMSQKYRFPLTMNPKIISNLIHVGVIADFHESDLSKVLLMKKSFKTFMEECNFSIKSKVLVYFYHANTLFW